MSTSVLWQPAETQGRPLGYQIKFALRTRFGDPLDVVLDGSHLEYLTGLRDGLADGIVVPELNELMDLIATHGAVRVFER